MIFFLFWIINNFLNIYYYFLGGYDLKINESIIRLHIKKYNKVKIEIRKV